MNRSKSKGAIQTSVALTIASGIVMMLASYFSSQSTTNAKIYEAKSDLVAQINSNEQEITKVQTDVGINIPALNKRLDSIDAKLDRLLKQ